MFTALEDRVAASQVLLDPRTAPEEALDWLVGWFGVALDAQWEEARRRLFIRHAASFLRQRGTLNGLHMALQLAFDACPDERLFTTPLAQREALSGIRIVERYRTRQTPGVVLGDPTEAAGLRLLSPAARWRPDDGAAQLQERYTRYVEAHGLTDSQPSVFAPVPPQEPTAWQQFTREVLGFIPSADFADLARWQAFLNRRYRTIDALNDRYHLTGTTRYTGFDVVSLPASLPPDGAALLDWYQFQSVALPMQRNAHRFVVLLPMPRTAYIDTAAQDERLALARRVIELEKPAHTTFDVRFYWAMFRVGEARLGYDTVVELGSRSPQFMSPLALGQGHLVEGYLALAHPAPEGRWYLAGDHR
jgi:phage tail-like protein